MSDERVQCPHCGGVLIIYPTLAASAAYTPLLAIRVAPSRKTMSAGDG